MTNESDNKHESKEVAENIITVHDGVAGKAISSFAEPSARIVGVSLYKGVLFVSDASSE